MTTNKQLKANIRARMAATGEPYSVAARHLGKLAPAELAERGVAAARARAARPHAERGFNDCQNLQAVEDWERRRAGRQVRLWTAVIETRTSAVDEHDAVVRLAIYLRNPLHRTGDKPMLQHTWDIDDEPAPPRGRRDIAPLDPVRLDAAERRHLVLDYPAAALAAAGPWEPYSPRDEAHVQDYLDSLSRGQQRLLGRFTEAGDRGLDRQRALPPRTHLSFWRSWRHVSFLSGPDVALARSRAAELAATIVDYAGHPAGRVIRLEPDDGFESAIDHLWCHPAEFAGPDGVTDLFDDYDLAEHGGGPAALAAVLGAARDSLDAVYRRDAAELRQSEALLHTQPDGTRTVSSRAELDAVAARTRAEHAADPPAKLREAADRADYMADRVYGKVVDSDADYKRIEHARHQAKILRQMANEAEAPSIEP